MNIFTRTTNTLFYKGIFICSAVVSTLTTGVSYSAQPSTFIAPLNPPKQAYKSISPDEATKLQQQLLEKTRELEEYKATLFRASHPKDQAKIMELNILIAQHEKTKQELIARIQEHEDELSNAKKQINNLEVSSDALTALIQNQRAIIEAKKQELAEKIRAHEEDPQLALERQKTQMLTAEVEDLKKALASHLASYESQTKELEIAHEEALHDALQDAAMLKFELADLRLSAQQKEHEIMTSMLHDLTIAFDHAKALKSDHDMHQEQFYESQQNLSSLQAAVEHLNFDKDHILSQHAVEKHVLETVIAENNETISHALIAHQLAIRDYVTEILSQSEDKANELEQAVRSLTSIAEHQDLALSEANSAFSRVQEYNQYLELENGELKQRLQQLETAERLRKKSPQNRLRGENASESLRTPAISPLLKPFLPLAK